MRKAFNRIAAGVTAMATIGTMFLTVAPVSAAGLTSTKDTLSREKVSVTGVSHSLTATLPSISTGNAIIFDYTTSGFANGAQTGASGACTGTCTLTVSATNVIITCTSGPCSGAFTTTGNFTFDNPGTTGSKSITYSSYGPESVSGTFAIPIVDDDQVTVTATVAPSITFDIDTATSDTESAAPYTVALGTLTTGSVTGSDESSINSIWLDLDTNASGGAVITVLSTNSSLKSTAAPGDTIASASAQMTPGTANYGLCLSSLTVATGSATSVSPFTDVQCDTTPVGNIVGALSGSTQNLITTTAAVSTLRAEILVDAAISALTAAHNDYTDTLTFIATGTF